MFSEIKDYVIAGLAALLLGGLAAGYYLYRTHETEVKENAVLINTNKVLNTEIKKDVASDQITDQITAEVSIKQEQIEKKTDKILSDLDKKQKDTETSHDRLPQTAEKQPAPARTKSQNNIVAIWQSYCTEDNNDPDCKNN